MSDYDYDVLIIGSGPGGYVAAIRAAQLGLKTACVESRETLGGTCLNVGCIPSKALLHGSELFDEAAHGTLAKFGVKTGKVEIDVGTLQGEKAAAVKDLTGGIAFLFKKNKVDWLKGHATFKDAHTVEVDGAAHTAKNIVIATGSSVTPLPGVEVDNDKGVTDEPVAMTMFFAVWALPATSTVCVSVKVAKPLSQSTLFFLNRKAIPPVRSLTAAAFSP